MNSEHDQETPHAWISSALVHGLRQHWLHAQGRMRWVVAALFLRRRHLFHASLETLDMPKVTARFEMKAEVESKRVSHNQTRSTLACFVDG